MTETFVTVIFAISPIVLAGLLVAWVWNIHTKLNALRNDIIQNNNAIVQAFAELRGQIQTPASKDTNASAPEAT